MLGSESTDKVILTLGKKTEAQFSIKDELDIKYTMGK